MLFKDSRSISSETSSKSSSSSIWNKISKLIHSHSRKRRSSVCSDQTSGDSTLLDESVKSVYSEEEDYETHFDRKSRKTLTPIADTSSTGMVIPPFSPTYCKVNEFPYSNFYVKLPDGRWMIRYRDGNRAILRTDIMEGYMI